MRDIKFRQAIFKDGKFHHWHYWGYVGHRGQFVSPIRIWQQSSPATYDIKQDQLCSGRRIGKLRVGREVYEGDIISSPLIKEKSSPCLVKFGEYRDIGEAGCTSHTNIGFYIQDAGGSQVGLLNEELLLDWDTFEVIGSNCETPELLTTGMA